MERFDINKYTVTDYHAYIGNAANYLTGLYYRTEQKYRCQAIKIELLLTIYQLWCLKYNKTGLMPTHNVKLRINPNKFRFKLNGIILPADIIDGKLKENKSPITDEFSDKNVVPPFFRDTNDYLNNDAKELLQIIFRKFGNWSAKALSIESQVIINELLSLYDNPEFITAEMLNNQKLSSKLGKKKDNEIIHFICTCKPKTNNIIPAINSFHFMVDFENWFNSLSYENQKKCIQMCNKISNTLIEDPKVSNNQKIKTIWNDRKFKK